MNKKQKQTTEELDQIMQLELTALCKMFDQFGRSSKYVRKLFETTRVIFKVLNESNLYTRRTGGEFYQQPEALKETTREQRKPIRGLYLGNHMTTFNKCRVKQLKKHENTTWYA